MERTCAVIPADKLALLTLEYASASEILKADGTISGYWLLQDYFTEAQTADVSANDGQCYDMSGFYDWYDTIKE